MNRIKHDCLPKNPNMKIERRYCVPIVDKFAFHHVSYRQRRLDPVPHVLEANGSNKPESYE